MVQHFREWWLFGLFFALVTPLQMLWAILVWCTPKDRRLLALGATLSMGVACMWVISRTAGIPFGPDTFRPEQIGFKDVMATVDELLLAALVALVLWRMAAPRLMRATAWTLTALSVLAANLPGGH
jgi:hypothetical protein